MKTNLIIILCFLIMMTGHSFPLLAVELILYIFLVPNYLKTLKF